MSIHWLGFSGKIFPSSVLGGNFLFEILQTLNGPIQAFQSYVNAPILEATCAGNAIQTNMICAGNLALATPPSGVCTGNIGGGLFCNVNNWFELTGVLSFGSGCGAINSPGIYMAVRDFNVWINQQLTRTDATNPGIRVVPLP